MQPVMLSRQAGKQPVKQFEQLIMQSDRQPRQPPCPEVPKDVPALWDVPDGAAVPTVTL